MAAEVQESAQRTQIVVQWLVATPRTELDLQDVWSAEDTLDGQSAGLFEVDGHDFGPGTANVFLYSSDPEAAVTRIVQIFDHGLLRAGMRIGVAQYTNAAMTYRPAYPPDLKNFEVI